MDKNGRKRWDVGKEGQLIITKNGVPKTVGHLTQCTSAKEAGLIYLKVWNINISKSFNFAGKFNGATCKGFCMLARENAVSVQIKNIDY